MGDRTKGSVLKQVSAALFAELLRATSPRPTVFDLRETFGAAEVPYAQPLSLAALQAGDLPKVPKDEPLYLICERGAVSELAGLYLEAAGFSEVCSVLGGWKAYRALPSAETD